MRDQFSRFTILGAGLVLALSISVGNLRAESTPPGQQGQACGAPSSIDAGRRQGDQLRACAGDDLWFAENAKAEIPPFADSVLPVVGAKRHELVGNDHQIGDHVRIVPTPGHTPGHVAVAMGRGKDDAVFSGDLMHSPLQTLYPELSIKFDVDPAKAAMTRRSFLERYCDTDTLCCTAHFPSPSVGKIKRKGNAFVCAAA